jgi:hypothetical protein
LIALHSPDYDTFLHTIVQTIQIQVNRNATLWLASKTVISQIPVPYPLVPQFFKLIFPNPTPEEARLISEFALKINQSDHVFELEYAVGQKIVEKFWPLAYPNQKLPKLRSLNENSKIDSDANTLLLEAIKSVPCNRGPLDTQFEKEKNEGWKSF